MLSKALKKMFYNIKHHGNSVLCYKETNAYLEPMFRALHY